MSAPAIPEGWMTPADVAIEWKKSERWVKDRMLDGQIPSVKVGGSRFFTPECRARLVAAQLGDTPTPTAAQSWGRSTRGKAS